MIKKMLNLKKISRTTNLPNILGIEMMEEKLLKSKILFMKRLLNDRMSMGALKRLERNTQDQLS